MILTAIAGLITGGLGSWINKGIGIYERKQDFAHEIKLLEMQKEAAKSETENQLAIAHEDAAADIRAGSYRHDMAAGETSLWVNNLLRLVRPVLTLMLICLVGAIWFTTDDASVATRAAIIESIVYMASSAMGWWFGDRRKPSMSA